MPLYIFIISILLYFIQLCHRIYYVSCPGSPVGHGSALCHLSNFDFFIQMTFKSYRPFIVAIKYHLDLKRINSDTINATCGRVHTCA